MLGRPEDTVSIADGAEKYKMDYEMTFAKGCNILGEEDRNLIPEHHYKKIIQEDQDRMLKEAVEAAKNADKVILTLGEHRCMSGEAASRAELTLPKAQENCSMLYMK